MHDTAELTSSCFITAWHCELCGQRDPQITVRSTITATPASTCAARAANSTAPIRLATPTAADEHRQHLTRARGRGEL